MATQSWICCLCHQNQAAFCCVCTTEGSALCSDCIPSHYSKASGLLHITIPAQFFGEHRVTGYFDRLQVRLATIPQRKEKLLSQLGQIEKCYKEFAISIEQIVTAVRDYASKTKESLRKATCELEKSIREGIDEAEKTIYVDVPELDSLWAKFIRYAEPNIPVPKVFQYTINPAAVIESLKSVLSYSCGYDFRCTELLKMPGVCGSHLTVYNIKTETKRKGLLTVRFTPGVVYCWLGLDSVLCVGGTPACPQAYAINAMTFKVSNRADMQHARSYAGIIPCGPDVYLFGGYKPYLRSCEVYNSYENSWRELGNMSDIRCCFTPCRYREDVYLFEAYVSRKELEVLDLVTEKYRVLEAYLYAFSGYTILFTSSSDLIIASSTQTVQLPLGGPYVHTMLRVENENSKFPVAVPPLVVENEAYVVDFEQGKLYVFHCVANKWKKKIMRIEE